MNLGFRRLGFRGQGPAGTLGGVRVFGLGGSRHDV